MLHVFYIFSNITARIVSPIIDHLDLDPAEVIVITDRSQTGASISDGLTTVNASFRPFHNRWKTLTSGWKNLSHNRQILDQITAGREFIAYLPGPSDQYSQQILWHPHCIQYRLFEEGLGSYCEPGVSPVQTIELTRLQSLHIGLRVRSLGRIRPALTDYPHWASKYGGCFGSNELAFPNHPPPVVNLNRPLFTASPSPFTRVVIFDDISVFGRDLYSAYLETIRDLVSSEHTGNDRWAYKLHPTCTEWPWLNEAVETIFRESLPPSTSFEKLSPDTCAEDIGSAKGITTYQELE